MPIGIILPFFLTIAIIDMIGVYTSYPIIKKYMIDPQLTNKKTSSDDEFEEELEEIPE
jgi:hypothetical protein